MVKPPQMVEEPLPHHPTLKEKEPNGLFCFLDKTRPCGAECMSFIASPAGDDYRDQQWSNCLLLVNAHRAGKHLVVLASVASEDALKKKNEAADAARRGQVPPMMPVLPKVPVR